MVEFKKFLLCRQPYRWTAAKQNISSCYTYFIPKLKEVKDKCLFRYTFLNVMYVKYSAFESVPSVNLSYVHASDVKTSNKSFWYEILKYEIECLWYGT